ncbi:MAG: hypothetical protein CVU65_02310 [Deltaproteobacteria bacterium HGW-Deltaproteobacteria-22]|nr:MAG: hypothetical protein CVU65_02310 [Deltaproteobacteria bacterium HGW-Deltaproteobacteria-22]
MTTTSALHRNRSRNSAFLRVLLALLMLGPAGAGGAARLRTQPTARHAPGTAEPAPELTWSADSHEPRQATLREIDPAPFSAIRPKKGDFRAVWKIPAPGAAMIPEVLSADDLPLASEPTEAIPGTGARRSLALRSPRGPPLA